MKTAGRILTAILLFVFTVSCAATTMLASSTPTPSATLTQTPRPSPTNTPTMTPAPTLSLDCESQESWGFLAKSDVIWKEFWMLDANTADNYDETTGQLLSTYGFEEISLRVTELAKLHTELQVPPLFADYNALAVKALEAYSKGVHETALGNGSASNLSLIDFQLHMEQADVEWAKIANYCKWPTPTPPPETS